jgi:hypothetical protein
MSTEKTEIVVDSTYLSHRVCQLVCSVSVMVGRISPDFEYEVNVDLIEYSSHVVTAHLNEDEDAQDSVVLGSERDTGYHSLIGVGMAIVQNIGKRWLVNDDHLATVVEEVVALVGGLDMCLGKNLKGTAFFVYHDLAKSEASGSVLGSFDEVRRLEPELSALPVFE